MIFGIGGEIMKKELFAVFCVVTIMAGTAPIFAANPTTTNTVVLTGNQTAKLTAVQTQLNTLITKIESLKKTYNNTTKKNKGLLNALNQYEKQATKLNTAITSYLKNPTSRANIKIKNFQIKTKQLQWKVNVTEKVLKKTIKKPVKPVKPIKPIKPVHPVGPVKQPVHPVIPVHPVGNCTTNATK
jgi:peptidoglycan hydrolase CwlO-like protein